MSDVFKPPASEVEDVTITNKRGMVAKITYSVLWLIPVSIFYFIALGAVVSIFSGSIGEGYNRGFDIGEDFGKNNPISILIGWLLMWLIPCFFGWLPGTSRNKREKK